MTYRHYAPRRILTVILACAVLLAMPIFFAACGKGGEDKKTDAPANPSNPSAHYPLPGDDADYPIEYGEPVSITNNSPPLYTYIRYPEIGLTSVDEAISGWAKDICDQKLADIKAAQKETGEAVEGEVNIQSRAFFVDDRYVGIETDGMFLSNQMANAQGIIGAFNVDIKSGKLLGNDEIIDPARKESIIPPLREEILSRYPDASKDEIDAMDASSLEYIALTHEGLDILIAPHTSLPGYLGTQIFTIPYAKISDALLVGADKDGGELPKKTAPATSGDGQQNANGAGQGNAATTPATQAPPADIDPNKPMLALTFDDGPSKYTNDILDLLEENGGRATFCVLGNLVGTRPEAVSRATSLGCEVFGHSWDHKQLTKLSKKKIAAELEDTRKAIEEASGQSVMLYRPPYGSTDKKVKSVSKKLGYSMVNWSVDTLDWKTRDADAVYKAVMKGAKDGQIILLHDIHKTTAQAMKRVIPALVEKGYQLVTVSDLFKYTEMDIQPGKIYFKAEPKDDEGSE